MMACPYDSGISMLTDNAVKRSVTNVASESAYANRRPLPILKHNYRQALRNSCGKINPQP
jgi:hypothetical protein